MSTPPNVPISTHHHSAVPNDTDEDTTVDHVTVPSLETLSMVFLIKWKPLFASLRSHSIRFQGLCIFPEATISANFRMSDFERYNGKGERSEVPSESLLHRSPLGTNYSVSSSIKTLTTWT